MTERALHQPEQLALLFIDEDGSRQAITAARLYQGAWDYAAALQVAGVTPNELVILVLPHSMQLVDAFWGALLLGAIPAIYPYLTPKLDVGVYQQRVRAAVTQSQAGAVVTYPEFKAPLQALLQGASCRVLAWDELSTGQNTAPGALPVPPGDGDRLAILLHTSGSSGVPKGVPFSHRQVLDHAQALGQAVAIQTDDVIVSWLPLHHDMGMIAGLLMPLVHGVPVVLMSPFYWIRSPIMLLRAVHEYQGTLTWMPNFAYNYITRSVRQRDLDGLDLSSWRMLINAAEPVRYDSHQIFLQRFAPLGLRPSALGSAYGMTEEGGVTVSPPGVVAPVDWVELRSLQEERCAVPVEPAAPGSTPIVSCGVPMPGVQIRIVDEQGSDLPERRVGEVVIHSSFLFRGYYRRPDLTNKVLRGGWYATADMGYLAGGHLYLCGRKTDMIIASGKNLYPQDLEAIADGVPGVYPGRTVALGVINESLGTEEIVLVCELRQPLPPAEKFEVERLLRRRVVQEIDIAPAEVHLLDETGWVLKTPAGKVARAANKEKYLSNLRRYE
ncbi:MAG: AMP-binding protein [Chloroflexota bacterium]